MSMDAKAIQEILKFVNKSDLMEVEIEQKDFRLHIKRVGLEGGAPQLIATTSGVDHHSLNLAPTAPAQPSSGAPAAPAQPAAPAPSPEAAAPAANTLLVRSPMIGTFYRRPGPDKEMFVQVGDNISKGQPVCIIEAMKLFNEIESEISGKIVKILVEDATPVEYDQPLFEVELA